MWPTFDEFAVGFLHPMHALAVAVGLYMALPKVYRRWQWTGVVCVVCALVLARVGMRLHCECVYLGRDVFEGLTYGVLTFWTGPGSILALLGFLVTLTPVTGVVMSLPGAKVVDTIVPALPAAQAVGRLGCFATGCCFGSPTCLPWGIRFPEDRIATTVFPDETLHPVQIYEAVGCVAILVFVIWLQAQEPKPLIVTGAYLLAYGSFRFAVQWGRAEEVLSPGACLTVSHIGALTLIGLGAILLGCSWAFRKPYARA